jgi:hypothetical protein
VTPLAQFAVTVPETADVLCVVISHFTSEQLPSGSPAIEGEPQAPLNADADGEVDPPVVDEPPDVVPAAPPVPVGAVGPRTFEVFSNAQPVATSAASNRLEREAFFIGPPLQFCIGTHGSVCVRGPVAQNSQEIEESV